MEGRERPPYEIIQTFDAGKKAAAKTCLDLIGNQYPWLTDAIKEKFGLET